MGMDLGAVLTYRFDSRPMNGVSRMANSFEEAK